MKSRTLTLIAAMTVFVAILVASVRLAAQESPAGQTQNPVPLINQPLVPDAAKPGGNGFKLTVNGTGFVSSSVVNWNGSARATTFISSSQLTATILASDIKKVSTASVTVVNPRPGGGKSNTLNLPIMLPNYFIFFARSNYPTGATPHAIFAGDFNGDGKLDLVTADSTVNSISVLLGNGDGTFQSAVSYLTEAGPSELAIGDFNGDGKLDLAVNSSAGFISVFLGNGDGTFQPRIDSITGNEPASITIGDFNADGRLDLAVTNAGDDTVSILLGNGDGTFQTQVKYPTGARPFPSTTGDFNGDGILDLAVGNQNGNSVSILLGKGDGTFGEQIAYPAGNQVYSLTTADLNADGKLDLAVANDADSTLSVLLGNGDGTLEPEVTYATGAGPHSVITADFNGDGKLDLATANEFGNSASILLGNGDGTFQSHVDYTAGSSAHMVVAGDFNRDGRLDLAVVNYNDDTVSVFLQNGTITLLPPALNFGGRLIGSRSPEKKVVLTNVGSATLNISSIALTGADTQDFLQGNNCGSSLPPRRHCTIRVMFKPTNLGPRTAAVTITDDAPGSPQSAPLSGTGLTRGRNATLSPTSLNFGNVVVGQSSSPQPTTLGNYGTKTVHITDIKITGTDQGDFSQQNNCPKYLRSLESCTISVTFTPQSVGSFSADVSVYDNAPGSPQQVSLSGTGAQCGGRCPCPSGCTCHCGMHGCFCSNASSAAIEETASRLTCSQINPFAELR